MAESYGISEIARELGVSRQRVHQKIKKCQNPYIDYNEFRTYERKEAKVSESDHVNCHKVICPYCEGITNRRITTKSTQCRKCGRKYILPSQMPIIKD